jgi:Short C-terminal domain
MTVSRMSLICWIVFAVMCAAFLPLTLGLDSVHVLPGTIRLAVSIALVGVLWWGPFAYAMYLGMAVTLNGDRRLLRRGVRGTAVVLGARATNTFVQKGGGPWQASRVYRYRLRVTIPGRSPYETDCAICAAGIREGSTVGVAASPSNHRRVTIDVGQAGDPEPRDTAPRDTGVTTYTLPSGGMGITIDTRSAREPADSLPNAERIAELTQLGRLHDQGVLTDAEFASEKARILGE